MNFVRHDQFPVVSADFNRKLSRKHSCRLFSSDQFILRFDKWLEVTGKSASTRRAYIYAVKRFVAFLDDKPLASVKADDVRAFLGSLYEANLSPATLAARLFALRTFYDFLHLGEQVSVVAPRLVVTRKRPKRLPQSISENDVTQLIAAARNPRDRAIVELFYASGLRINEIVNLNVDDLNLRARSLTVRRGKGGNDRVGLFGQPAAQALRDYIGDRTTGPVFQPLPREQHGGVWWDKKHAIWFGQWRETTESGKRVMRSIRLGDYELTRESAREALEVYLAYKLPSVEAPSCRLTVRQVRRVIGSTARRAGINHVHPHMLRHSCATHMLNRGADIRAIQELLGHATISTTAKYLHVATVELQASHAKFHPHGEA